LDADYLSALIKKLDNDQNVSFSNEITISQSTGGKTKSWNPACSPNPPVSGTPGTGDHVICNLIELPLIKGAQVSQILMFGGS